MANVASNIKNNKRGRDDVTILSEVSSIENRGSKKRRFKKECA